MHVEFVSRLGDVEMAAGFEAAFAVTQFPRYARSLVQPIHFAVAIQIDERVTSPLPRRDAAVAKLQKARRGFVDPPFRAAVLKSHLQIELAVFVDVGSQM